ncbi:MAG: DNA polymerase IV [Mangrovicoccus sp.]
MSALCRDCLSQIAQARRCPNCGSPRVLAHAELFSLSIAHMDCDAFYASVEKRDNPELRDKPVIVGGGRRGVVSTACYIARTKGVRSAMPMFQALKLCPEAVVVKGRMSAYVEVSRQIRAMMEELTPAIEPLSLDEAFLDLTGTARLHGAPPAVLLAGLVKRMQDELGISGSIGLSHNKFLAKLASDLDKPRGFAVIGAAETMDFLAEQPVRRIWGVGPSGQASLEAAGIRNFSDLRRWDQKQLIQRFGSMGERLYHLARGEDRRKVSRDSRAKSISNETTFHEDTADPDLLQGHLWRMAEKVADRAKAKELAGHVITLKLKRADHRLITRRLALRGSTQLAHVIFATGQQLLAQIDQPGPWRLLGLGLSDLGPADDADRVSDLLEPEAKIKSQAERAVDEIRAKFGSDAILSGRSLR